MSEIFLRCIRVSDDEPWLETMTTPLTLASVCSVWRNVALATPRLWSNIYYSFIPRHGQAESARLSLFLERSAPCLLSVRAIQAPPSRDPTQHVSIVENVIRALVAHSTRWESVQLRLQLRVFVLLELHLFPLPNLRHANLCILGGGGLITDNAKELVAFSTSPGLRSVALFCNRSVLLRLPFVSLTECTLGVTDAQTCIELLSSAHDLLKCSIENTDLWTDSFLPSLTSHVRSLEMSHVGGISRFLQALALPTLSRFAMKYTTSPQLSRALIDLGARSVWSDCLRELVIVRASLTVDEVIEFLSGLPRLQLLVAEGRYVGTKLLTRLTHTPGVVPLLPELRSIDMTLYGNHPVAEMIESRWSIPPCDCELIQRIKHVRLCMWRSKPEECSMRLETLGRLQREGLDLQFKCSWVIVREGT